eukprot:gene5524-6882_t
MISSNNNKKPIYFRSKFPDVVIPERSIPDVTLEHLKEMDPTIPIFIDGITHREYAAAEVVTLIERCASGVHKLGLNKGDVIGFYLPNIPEYPILFHSSLLMGCVASTINPEYTMDEMSKTVGTLNPRVFISLSATYDKVKDIKSVMPSIQHHIVVGEDTPEGTINYRSLLDNDGVYPHVPINAKVDPAVIPFSSGTTGLSKGVVLSHYNLLANSYQSQVIETPTYKRTDSVMGILPFFHIYGMMLFLILMVRRGNRVVILPRFDAERFLQLIEKYKVAISFIAPPVAILFAKSPLVNKYDLSSLRVLFSGAAPLSENVSKEIVNRFGGRVVIKQGYGMTEASPATHINPYGAERSGSVGILCSNQVCKIISTETGEYLGIGQSGEICIKGPNIMLGYYKNEKATRETIDQDGFLHTGDIGYVDEDGYYYVVDRVKELIKYKGYQVPPAELEGILLTHPLIVDSCVIGIPDGENGEVPRAYVVLKPDSTLTEDEIHKWLNPQVSHFKRLKGGIIFCNTIPKSATGKILRKNLKQPQSHL